MKSAPKIFVVYVIMIANTPCTHCKNHCRAKLPMLNNAVWLRVFFLTFSISGLSIVLLLVFLHTKVSKYSFLWFYEVISATHGDMTFAAEVSLGLQYKAAKKSLFQVGFFCQMVGCVQECRTPPVLSLLAKFQISLVLIHVVFTT